MRLRGFIFAVAIGLLVALVPQAPAQATDPFRIETLTPYDPRVTFVEVRFRLTNNTTAKIVVYAKRPGGSEGPHRILWPLGREGSKITLGVHLPCGAPATVEFHYKMDGGGSGMLTRTVADVSVCGTAQPNAPNPGRDDVQRSPDGDDGEGFSISFGDTPVIIAVAALAVLAFVFWRRRRR